MKTKITGIIISAGLSSRMGKFKPLLEYEGKSFLVNIIDKLLPICENVIIVTGYNYKVIKKRISEKYEDRVRSIYNNDYEKGMFTSLQRGIKEIKTADWIIYHQIDQPNLPSGFYTNFVGEIDSNYDWIQPTYNERKGHPILFNYKVMQEILNADAEGNLRLISSQNKFIKKLWSCEYSEIHTDIDTIEEFNKLKS